MTWVLGDSRAIPGGGFDLAVMSGNVAQHIPDPAWERTLSDLRRALRDGGVLVFESRNPRARAWTTWSSRRTDVQAHRATARSGSGWRSRSCSRAASC